MTHWAHLHTVINNRVPEVLSDALQAAGINCSLQARLGGPHEVLVFVEKQNLDMAIHIARKMNFALSRDPELDEK